MDGESDANTKNLLKKGVTMRMRPPYYDSEMSFSAHMVPYTKDPTETDKFQIFWIKFFTH